MAKQADGDRVALARGLYADLMVALAGAAAQPQTEARGEHLQTPCLTDTHYEDDVQTF